jgi:hypothetical protein
MKTWPTAVATLLLLGALPTASLAQDKPSPEPQVDATKLPVDLARMQRKLKQAVEREERNGPVLRYTIDVFGRAPRIELITPRDNLAFTPAPYGAPTHREMMNVVTPREFSSPVMDLNNFWRWLAKEDDK